MSEDLLLYEYDIDLERSFAPPFGVGFYAAAAIGRVDPNLGMRPILGYMLAMLVGLLVVAAVPWISIGFL
jgi:TRAP-type C4-dicarboxylate transport system permease large subunit